MIPLVSCILPTRNRKTYLGTAIASYFSQTYLNKELIIVDNGDDGSEEVVPPASSIHYFKVSNDEHKTVGEMRNICNDLANGEIICHFDSDDWSAPNRIQEQVNRLTIYNFVAYNTMVFFDVRDGQWYKWSSRDPYAFGTSFCYWKSQWKANLFRHTMVGEDFFFFHALRRINPSKVFTMDVGDVMVARIHKDQTCHKALKGEFYKSIPPVYSNFLVMDIEKVAANPPV
jgi:glycosyltransferase involved in cell wall biosynthesis